ncbi:phage capsid family protein [Kingella negevensis]
MPRPIRFYAGDKLKYCKEYESETESELLVPASFGDKFAIDRSIILGGQAVLEAFAAARQSSIPFFWSEKTDIDHGDKAELLIGMIRGVAKTRFNVDTGNGMQWTDYGVTVVDTAVPIIGAKQ